MNSLFENMITYLEQKKDIENCSSHSEKITENNIIICLECGEEIQRIIMNEREWTSSNTQMRKSKELTIAKDVKNMEFSESIISKANEFFDIVREEDIYRAGSRKGIIFACIYYAYKIEGKDQNPEKLRQVFGINNRQSLKGLKILTMS